MTGKHQEVFAKLAQAKQLPMTTQDKQPTRGHKFRNLAMMDGAGGSWTQLYECECGALYLATRAGKKAPVHHTVVDTDCPLSPSEARA